MEGSIRRRVLYVNEILIPYMIRCVTYDGESDVSSRPSFWEIGSAFGLFICQFSLTLPHGLVAKFQKTKKGTPSRCPSSSIVKRKGRVAQIVLCHPELDSGSHNLLILLDAETSSAWHNSLNCHLGNTPKRLEPKFFPSKSLIRLSPFPEGKHLRVSQLLWLCHEEVDAHRDRHEQKW